MATNLYLAYGSNLNQKQMMFRCPTAKAVGSATLKGYKLSFKGGFQNSFLTIAKSKNSSVEVGVWQVTKQDEKSLDRYEGYPRVYEKAELQLPIKLFNGKVVKRKAFVYIMSGNNPITPPTSHYFDVCLDGYDDFGFDKNALFSAYDECNKGGEI